MSSPSFNELLEARESVFAGIASLRESMAAAGCSLGQDERVTALHSIQRLESAAGVLTRCIVGADGS